MNKASRLGFPFEAIPTEIQQVLEQFIDRVDRVDMSEIVGATVIAAVTGQGHTRSRNSSYQGDRLEYCWTKK